MDTDAIRDRLEGFRREEGRPGIADAIYMVTRDVPALLDEVDRMGRWLSHIAAYPDEFSPAVKAAREALAGLDTKPEWRYAE